MPGEWGEWANSKGCLTLIVTAIFLTIAAALALPTPIPFDDVIIWGVLLSIIGVLTVRLLKLLSVVLLIIGVVLIIGKFIM